MANWSGAARSSYFRVKGERAFREAMRTVPGLEIVHKDSENERDKNTLEGRPVRRFALLETEGAGWPSNRYWEDEDFDLFDFVSGHLAAGEVAIFQEAGAEKLRYVSGFSVAINAEGERISLDLDDIYEKVRQVGWTERAPLAAY